MRPPSAVFAVPCRGVAATPREGFSTEVRDILEQKLAQKVRTIGTTAFTDKPVSMKYRGVFDLHSRKEGRLNYLGEAGKWSLEQALTWWHKTQQKQP